MRTRPLALVGHVLLVALAGCSVLNGDAPTTDSGALDGVAYSPGAAPAGFENASQVLREHQARLATDSYQIEYALTQVLPEGVANTSTVVASNESQRRLRERTTLPGRSIDQCNDGDQRHRKVKIGNSTSYDTQPVNGSTSDVHYEGARPGPLLATIVSAGNFTATGTDTVAGRSVITYNSTELRANATGQLPDEVDRFDASVSIDEAGRIREATMTASGRINNVEVLTSQEFQTVGVGDVTVSRPDWVDNATGERGGPSGNATETPDAAARPTRPAAACPLWIGCRK